MTNLMFSVYDEKSEAFLLPFFLQTKGQAIRAITDCVNDTNHTFYKHPSDYTLFELGSFDDSTGLFVTKKTSIGNLVEFKTQINSIPDLQNVTKLAGGTD